MGGWRSVEEIAAYRLACELRDRIHALVDAGRAAQDYDFSQQVRRSTSSAASNLSEGFERYYHGEFAYFTRMAKASLGGTINHLGEPRARKYIAQQERESLLDLAYRAKRATTGLLKYLLHSRAPGEESVRKRRLKRPRGGRTKH
jgi:four helix bundle protein